jgi:hypothetical protein
MAQGSVAAIDYKVPFGHPAELRVSRLDSRLIVAGGYAIDYIDPDPTGSPLKGSE